MTLSPVKNQKIDYLQDQILDISNKRIGVKKWDENDYDTFESYLFKTMGYVSVGTDQFFPYDILKALKPEKYQALFRDFWDERLVELIAEVRQLKAQE